MERKEYLKLHAEWYELASAEGDHSAEIDFWLSEIAAAGQPVLELGCGTGRVLIPLLERGIDVVGMDNSPDMMDRCRAQCADMGLKPVLYEQTMQELALSRQFALAILTSGGLGLFTADRDIQATFERVLAHLRPGGLFIYCFEPLPDGNAKDDGRWSGGWVNGSGGVVIAQHKRHKYDPATHTWRQLVIFEKFIGGRLAETEADEREGRFFSVDEAMQYARSAGFEEIQATQWLTGQLPNKLPPEMAVRCRTPS